MFRCYQSLLTSQTFPTSGTDPQQAQFFLRPVLHICISHLCGLSITSCLLFSVAEAAMFKRVQSPYSPKVPVVAQLDSAPAGGAPPPPAARGGLSQREEAAAQVSVSRGQRCAPGGAGCKGNSLVPCAPWRRQIHHHRRGGARGGNEGEALAQRPGPSRSTRPEHRRDCRPGSPQRRDPQA